MALTRPDDNIEETDTVMYGPMCFSFFLDIQVSAKSDAAKHIELQEGLVYSQLEIKCNDVWQAFLTLYELKNSRETFRTATCQG